MMAAAIDGDNDATLTAATMKTPTMKADNDDAMTAMATMMATTIHGSNH